MEVSHGGIGTSRFLFYLSSMLESVYI